MQWILSYIITLLKWTAVATLKFLQLSGSQNLVHSFFENKKIGSLSFLFAHFFLPSLQYLRNSCIHNHFSGKSCLRNDFASTKRSALTRCGNVVDAKVANSCIHAADVYLKKILTEWFRWLADPEIQKSFSIESLRLSCAAA